MKKLYDHPIVKACLIMLMILLIFELGIGQ